MVKSRFLPSCVCAGRPGHRLQMGLLPARGTPATGLRGMNVDKCRWVVDQVRVAWLKKLEADSVAGRMR